MRMSTLTTLSRSACAQPLARVARRGFSLIELLVVIAIISLMIAILLPVLSRVRSRGQTVVCLSNTRQIIAAINADAADNGGKLPENRTITTPKVIGDDKSVTPGEHVTWRWRFAEGGLGLDSEMWICPGQPTEPITELGEWGNGTICIGDVPASYALNGHVLWRPELLPADAAVSDTAIARPSHTILLAESRAKLPDIRVTDNLVAADFPDGGFFGFWHDGDGVYGFQDGHAEAINFWDTGNPDCRWHNGRDLSEDRFDKQSTEEQGQHGHPNWEYLIHDVYVR